MQLLLVPTTATAPSHSDSSEQLRADRARAIVRPLSYARVMSATFRLGYKNILGSNWTRVRHRWPGRAVMLNRELNGDDGTRASVYFFVEVNRPAQRRSLRQILSGWDVVRSTHGHNDAYSDPTQHRLINSHELPLGTRTRQQRYVTIARYLHLASDVEWTAATTHLSSSAGTTPELAATSREVQALRLAELCHEHTVDVIAADLNNVVARPGTPRGVLEAHGYRDWRSLAAIDNVDYDSHRMIGQPVPRTGRHLDAIYVGPQVSVLNGRVQITEPNSSDHLAFVCTVSIS